MAGNNISQRLARTVLGGNSLQARLVALLMDSLADLWGSFEGWFDDDGVEQAARLAAEAEAQTLKKVQAMAASTARELARQTTGQTQKTDALGEFQYPRNADPVELWKRPAEQYRYAVSTGESEANALVAALDRADHIARTNVQLTKRDAQIVQFRRSERIIGYRRIIHPELSTSGVCGLCVVAADRIYSVDDLMPIHDGCNCGVAPVTKSNDPGLKLNQDDLEALYQAGGSTSAADLKKIRVTTYEHGELGPVLVKIGHQYLNEEEAKSRQRSRKPRLKVVDENSISYIRNKEWRTAEESKRLYYHEKANLKRYQQTLNELQSGVRQGDDLKVLGMTKAIKRTQKAMKFYKQEWELSAA